MPAVTRDIALLVPKAIKYAQLEELIVGQAKNYGETHGGVNVEDIRCVDVYEGKGIEPGHLSIAIRFRLRAEDRTLKTEEVNEIVNLIVTTLALRFGVSLRS
jgi:phenylalanyl-tRNA synthetase beta chain